MKEYNNPSWGKSFPIISPIMSRVYFNTANGTIRKLLAERMFRKLTKYENAREIADRANAMAQLTVYTSHLREVSKSFFSDGVKNIERIKIASEDDLALLLNYVFNCGYFSAWNSNTEEAVIFDSLDDIREWLNRFDLYPLFEGKSEQK